MRARDERRGMAFATVLMVVTVFTILAGVMLSNSWNQKPLEEKMDLASKANYVAMGLLEIIELKIKVLPEEFRDALLASELGSPTPAQKEVYETFLKDVSDPTRLKNEFRLDDPVVKIKLQSVKRQFMGKQTGPADSEQYVTDLVDVTVQVTYPESRAGSAAGSAAWVTKDITRTLKFRRKLKSTPGGIVGG